MFIEELGDVVSLSADFFFVPRLREDRDLGKRDRKAGVDELCVAGCCTNGELFADGKVYEESCKLWPKPYPDYYVHFIFVYLSYFGGVIHFVLLQYINHVSIMYTIPCFFFFFLIPQ
jgi:hypothetical protein